MAAATRKPKAPHDGAVPPPWVTTLCPRGCPAQRRGVPAGVDHQREPDHQCDTFCPCASAVQAGIIALWQSQWPTTPAPTTIKPPDF